MIKRIKKATTRKKVTPTSGGVSTRKKGMIPKMKRKLINKLWGIQGKG